MREIKMWGATLEEAVRSLLRYRLEGEDVYCDFNGTVLRSSDVTLDRAYIAVTGKTYSEYKESEMRRAEKWKKEDEEYKRDIPKLKKHYLIDSLYLIKPEMVDDWIRLVDARLSDLYQGLDLASAIEVMKALDKGVPVKTAKNVIENQGHSGLSYSIVRAIVMEFSSRGQEFWDATQM